MSRLFLTMAASLTLAAAALAATFQGQSQQQPSQPSQQTPERQQGQSGTRTTNQQTTQRDQGKAEVSSSDRRFVTEAAEAGQAEIAHSQLALQRATNEDVKRFAQRMVDDHTKTNQELMQLASSKGITLPQGTMGPHSGQTTGADTTGTQTRESGQSVTGRREGQPQSGSQAGSQTGQQGTSQTGTQTTGQIQVQGKHRESMEKLSKLSGPEFDREYMRQQLKAHEKAISLFEREANSGKDPELKAFASNTLPALREHQQLARDTASKVGISDKSASKSTNRSDQPSDTNPARPQSGSNPTRPQND
jgi:predicted outer membrane protein